MGGHLILGPCNKDPTIEGTTLGSPIFGNSQIQSLVCKGTPQIGVWISGSALQGGPRPLLAVE